LVYPGDGGLPRGTYHTDTNNFAPRLAMAWDPIGDGRTSIRTAWGLFYDSIPGQGDFFQNGTLAPPFQPLTQVDFPVKVTGPSFANPLQGVTGAGTPFPAGLIFIGWGPDFTTPVVQQYNFSVQRSRKSLGIGSRLRRFLWRSPPDFHRGQPTIPVLTPTPAIGARVFPAYSLVRPTFRLRNPGTTHFKAACACGQLTALTC